MLPRQMKTTKSATEASAARCGVRQTGVCCVAMFLFAGNRDVQLLVAE